MYIWLVFEPTPLKNIKVDWDEDIPNIWEKKKCSKPPARYILPHLISNRMLYLINEVFDQKKRRSSIIYTNGPLAVSLSTGVSTYNI